VSGCCAAGWGDAEEMRVAAVFAARGGSGVGVDVAAVVDAGGVAELLEGFLVARGQGREAAPGVCCCLPERGGPPEGQAGQPGEHPLRLLRIDPLLPQGSDLRRHRVTVGRDQDALGRLAIPDGVKGVEAGPPRV
jgi:hypothetical protein